jgi:hypothetical protein
MLPKISTFHNIGNFQSKQNEAEYAQILSQHCFLRKLAIYFAKTGPDSHFSAFQCKVNVPSLFCNQENKVQIAVLKRFNNEMKVLTFLSIKKKFLASKTFESEVLRIRAIQLPMPEYHRNNWKSQSSVYLSFYE